MRRLGPLAVEYSGAETSKFTAPILLVHGLWDRGESWRGFTGFLSHRGWRCASVSLPGPDGRPPADSIADLLGELGAAIEAMEAPPVIIGHDLGALLALLLEPRARAVVALSPLVPMPVAEEPPRALAAAGSWMARWRGGALRAPRGAWRASYDASFKLAESRRLLAELAGPVTVPGRGDGQVPKLVMVGDCDAVTTAPLARLLADAVGAEFDVFPGLGHPTHRQKNWEDRVGQVHRWIVRSFGTDLLALYEEAWADRDA